MKNPLRILDTKVEHEIKILNDAPKIIDCLDKDDKIHFDKVLSLLNKMKVDYFIDHKLVRGLDYYSRTVFEIQNKSLGAQDALCGGGRYDNLVQNLGGKSTPAFGFAAGIERLILALDIDSLNINQNLDVYIVSVGDNAIEFSMNIANQLRVQENLTVLTDT